jgi:hypothetical protein
MITEQSIRMGLERISRGPCKKNLSRHSSGVTKNKYENVLPDINITAFCAVSQCISERARYFGAIYCLPPASAGFLLTLIFYPEDGGDIFLRNIALSFFPKYMVLQTIRPYSSQSRLGDPQIHQNSQESFG